MTNLVDEVLDGETDDYPEVQDPDVVWKITVVWPWVAVEEATAVGPDAGGGVICVIVYCCCCSCWKISCCCTFICCCILSSCFCLSSSCFCLSSSCLWMSLCENSLNSLKVWLRRSILRIWYVGQRSSWIFTMALEIQPAQAVLSLVCPSMNIKSLSSLSEIWVLLSFCLHILSTLLLVVLLPVVAEAGGGVLHTLSSSMDPESTGSSAGSKSVDRCEGMLADAEVAEANEVPAEAVVVVVDAEVAEAELTVAEAEPEVDVVEAGFN